MRAMRVHRTAPIADAPLSLDDVPVPTPGPDEALVRVHACAVCRTDLHVIEGDLPETHRPLTPGHMVVGTVEALGARAEGLRVGQRVGVAWLRGTCGRCRYCRSLRENLCGEATFTGYHAEGGYADYTTVPADWAYALPDGADDLEATPLLCAGIIGYRALELSGAQRGDSLGLVGFGNSAHVVLQIAQSRGIRTCVATRGAGHRELARDMGAAWVGTVDELAPESLEAAILFAPAGNLVPPLLRALRRGGTLACAGIHMSPIPALDYDHELFGERVLRSVTANTRADGLGLLREAARIGLRPRVTEYPLEAANRALLDLAEDRVRGAAVLRVSR